MSTLKQVITKPRTIISQKIKNTKLSIKPQYKAVCVRVLTTSNGYSTADSRKPANNPENVAFNVCKLS